MTSSILKCGAGFCLALGILAFWPFHWLGFLLPKTLFSSVGLIFSLIFCACERRVFKIQKPEFLLVAFLFCFFVFYTVFSIAPLSSFLGVSGAMQGLSSFWIYGACFVVALSLHESEIMWAETVTLGLHFLMGGYALVQFFGLDPLHFLWDTEALLGRSFSFLGNPNWVASFMVLTWPLFFKVAPFTRRWKLGILLAFEWAVLLSTGSKAGLLAGLFLTVYFLWASLKPLPFLREITVRRMLLLLTVAGVFTLLIGGFLGHFFYPTLDIFARSILARTVLWQDTLTLLFKEPWGHGLDVFRFVYPRFASPELYQHESVLAAVDSPHNQILQLWFEIGPFGTLLFYGTILFLTRAFWLPFLGLKNHIAQDESDFKRPLALGIFAYLFTLLFGFETLATGAVFWFFLGLLARSYSAPSPHVSGVNYASLSCQVLLTCGLFFLLVFQAQHLWADLHFDRAQNAFGRVGTPLHEFEAAVKLYPYDRAILLQAAQVALAQSNWDSNLAESVDWALSQVEHLSQGQDSDAFILYAQLFSREGNPDAALEWIARARESRPHDFRTLWLALELVEDTPSLSSPALSSELCAQITPLLPVDFQKPQTDFARIFLKNYPWFVEAWGQRCAD